MRKPRKSLRGEDLREAARWRRAGVKLSAIASHFGVSQSHACMRISDYETERKIAAIKAQRQRREGVAISVPPSQPSISQLCKPISAKTTATASFATWSELSLATGARYK